MRICVRNFVFNNYLITINYEYFIQVAERLSEV